MSVGKVRVLVIDDDARVGRDLRARLDASSFEVVAATGAGRALAADALTRARTFRPHVAVVDYRLCDGGGAPDGLGLMNELRSAGLVLYSGHLRVSIVDQAKQQFRCQVVAKGDDHPNKLITAIGTSATDICGFGRQFTVKYPPNWSPSDMIEAVMGPGTGIPDDAITAVIWQLLQQQSDEKADIHRVNLETMEGSVQAVHSIGRERSVLLKAFREGRVKPLILKLSSARSVGREFDHYKEHVEDNLGGDFFAIVRNKPVCFWGLGGLAYQFLGGKNGDLENLATCYFTSDTSERVLVPLRHFFNVTWRDLYDRKEDCDRSLYEVYDTSLHLGQRLSALEDSGGTTPFPGLKGVDLPNPMGWIRRYGAQFSYIHSAKIAPTHGDLHADNLLVDREHAWAIDFERTGLGHWLRDFAELEVDILTRLMSLPKEGASELFGKLAIALAEPRKFDARLRLLPGQPKSRDLNRVVEVILGLRRIAHRIVNCTDFREYLWALLFDAVFVATLPSQTAEQRQRALLLGAILCDRLEHWRGGWPLQEQVSPKWRDGESQ